MNAPRNFVLKHLEMAKNKETLKCRGFLLPTRESNFRLRDMNQSVLIMNPCQDSTSPNTISLSKFGF